MPSFVSQFVSGLLADTRTQADAYALAIRTILGGGDPVIVDEGGGSFEVQLNPAQQEAARALLNRWLEYKPPLPGTTAGPKRPGVNIQIMPVLLPVLVKNFWYIPMLPYLGGFLTGRHFGKKKR